MPDSNTRKIETIKNRRTYLIKPTANSVGSGILLLSCINKRSSYHVLLFVFVEDIVSANSCFIC